MRIDARILHALAPAVFSGSVPPYAGHVAGCGGRAQRCLGPCLGKWCYPVLFCAPFTVYRSNIFRGLEIDPRFRDVGAGSSPPSPASPSGCSTFSDREKVTASRQDDIVVNRPSLPEL